MVKCCIFIRSYWKDAPWLRYALRSIRKYTSGFAYTIIVTPSRDHHIFLPMSQEFGCKLYEYQVNEEKPMIHGEVLVCRADEICPDVDLVLFTDSDCCFDKKTSPEDYLVKGKPIIIANSFAWLAQNITPTRQIILNNWVPATRNVLGFTPEYETNSRVPCIFRRDTFAPFRAAVEKHTGRGFDEYAFSCKNEFPQSFLEFTPLGNFVLKNLRDQYFFADMNEPEIHTITDGGEAILAKNMRQFWSHSGLTKEEQAELESICSGA